MDDATVADKAIRAAWDTCQVLEQRTSPEQRRLAQQRVQAAMEECGAQEVARATILLINVLVTQLINQEGLPQEDRLDPLRDLIPAVIRKLPSFEIADPAEAPMATGVLMAAAMDMNAVAWRDRYGPIPPQEFLIHTFVLWLLADLTNSMWGQPGYTDRVIQTVLKSGPT
ncbi:hypothetical protein [Streptomyces carpaticus]|uniref:hypothetical protein n=1 Tax=Streptomyces carpaticus TaxID=285558 RepID=UPI0031F98B9C